LAEEKDLYERVWGEPAPEAPTAGEGRNGSRLSLNNRPAEPGTEPPPEVEVTTQHRAAALAGEATTWAMHSLEGRNAVLVQQQMAETLRRLEARVGHLQQQVQPYTEDNFRETVAAVNDISERIIRTTAELRTLIEFSQRLVKDLSGVQAQSLRGLEAIEERLRELERPRRFRH
jgi:hypothetical protein